MSSLLKNIDLTWESCKEAPLKFRAWPDTLCNLYCFTNSC